MRESRIPFNGALVEPPLRGSYPDGWVWGLGLPRALTYSRWLLADPHARRALGSNKHPFWWTFDYSDEGASGPLQAQQTLTSGISPNYNFVALSVIASTDQLKGFRAQFRQLTDENGAGSNWSRVGIELSNCAGTAANPLCLRHPVPLPNNLSLLNRTANKADSTDPSAGVNKVQICIYGVRD